MEQLKTEVYTAAEEVYKSYEKIGLKHPIPFLGTVLQYICFEIEEMEPYRLLFLTPGTSSSSATSSMIYSQNMVREPSRLLYIAKMVASYIMRRPVLWGQLN